MKVYCVKKNKKIIFHCIYIMNVKLYEIKQEVNLVGFPNMIFHLNAIHEIIEDFLAWQCFCLFKLC